MADWKSDAVELPHETVEDLDAWLSHILVCKNCGEISHLEEFGHVLEDSEPSDGLLCNNCIGGLLFPIPQLVDFIHDLEYELSQYQDEEADYYDEFR